MGLIDLAAVLPGPATIDFTKIPVDQAEVVSLDGERVHTAQWHSEGDSVHCFVLPSDHSCPPGAFASELCLVSDLRGRIGVQSPKSGSVAMILFSCTKYIYIAQ